MILLPEEIIELILSYAPDFRDNLKRCQKEMMLTHRPLYVKKVVAGFSPGIADSPTWPNFGIKNNEIRIWRLGTINAPMEYMLLKLHAIEITPEREVYGGEEEVWRWWHTRDMYLYYGWTKADNKTYFDTIYDWNTESNSYEFTPGYY